MFFERKDLPVNLLIKIIVKAITNQKFDQLCFSEVAKNKNKEEIYGYIDAQIEDIELKGEVITQLIKSRIVQRGRITLGDLP